MKYAALGFREKALKCSSPEPEISFLKSHGRSLSIVGALIVFATFVIKEGFKDKLKDTVDTATNTQNVFLIRNDSNALAYQLLGIEQSLNPTGNPILWSWQGGDRRLVLLAHMQQNIGASLENMNGLLARLPETKDHKQEISALQKRYEVVIEDHTTAVRMMKDATDRTQERPKYEELANYAMLQDLKFTLMLATDVQNVGVATVKDLEEKKDKEEHIYSSLTWASYGLYTIGWTLGFLGKIYGVSISATEE